MTRLTPRVRGPVLAAAVLAVYGAGVLTGTASGDQSQKRGTGDSVVDEAASRISRDASKPPSQQELQHAAVNGMLRPLGDRYAKYYSRASYDDFHVELGGHYGGVGLLLRDGRRDDVIVSGVRPHSPAARAGVHDGDAMVRVGRTGPGAGVAAMATALRGHRGSTVHVVLRSGTHKRRIRLVRASIPQSDVSTRQLSKQILDIRVSMFSQHVGQRVRQIMASRHPDGVLLDLRDNPGGLLNEAVSTASVFLPPGRVVSYEQRGRPEHTYNVVGHGDTRTPLVVLVDHGTASAAEVVSAALQDRGRAVVVGSRTYGKGTVQEQRRLSDGTGLELTVGRYHTPSGRTVDNVGVKPDIKVSSSAPPQAARQRGDAVLSGLLATAPTHVSAKSSRG